MFGELGEGFDCLTPFRFLWLEMGVHYTPRRPAPDRGRPPHHLKKRIKIFIKFFINYVKTVAI